MAYAPVDAAATVEIVASTTGAERDADGDIGDGDNHECGPQQVRRGSRTTRPSKCPEMAAVDGAMKPLAWLEGPTSDADKERVVRAAIVEVLGDSAATDTLLMLIPDPPLPVDRTALARRSMAFEWGPRGWGLAASDLDLARDLLRELFESRCDELTLIAISGAADLASDAAKLSDIAAALMTRPTPADAAGGRPFVGLTYDWGDPIRRFDTTGETLYM